MNSKLIIVVVVATAAALAAGRQLTVRHTPNRATLDSLAADGKDRMKFALVAEGNSPSRFFLKYFTRAGDKKSSLKLHVTFLSLIEYRDAPNPNATVTDGFQPEVDEVVQDLKLEGKGWTKIFKDEVNFTAYDGTNHTRYEFFLCYRGPAGGQDQEGCLLLISVHFSDVAFSVNGTTYQPNNLKVDISIEGGDFVKGNDTHIGLLCKVQSVDDCLRNGNGCQLGGNGTDAPMMRLAWEPNFIADGRMGDIMVGEDTKFNQTMEDLDDKQDGDYVRGNKWWFSFNGLSTTNIFWDPSIGATAPWSEVYGAPLVPELPRPKHASDIDVVPEQEVKKDDLPDSAASVAATAAALLAGVACLLF